MLNKLTQYDYNPHEPNRASRHEAPETPGMNNACLEIGKEDRYQRGQTNDYFHTDTPEIYWLYANHQECSYEGKSDVSQKSQNIVLNSKSVIVFTLQHYFTAFTYGAHRVLMMFTCTYEIHRLTYADSG